MKLEIPGTEKLILKKMLSVYTGKEILVMSHDVALDEENKPLLLAGKIISDNEIDEFLTYLKPNESKWTLTDENIVAQSRNGTIWWSPAKKRPLHFKTESEELNKYSGKIFAQPALVFRLTGSNLNVWALKKNTKPTLDTPLYLAPFYNISPVGSVCMSPIRSGSAYQDFEKSFWNSFFTHANTGGKRLVKGTESYPDFLKSCTRQFPVEKLIPAELKLRDIFNENSK